MAFGEKVGGVRGEAGFTQASLASQRGLRLGVVRDYEQGKRKPMLESAFKLCRALAVPVESFAECEWSDGLPPKAPRGRPPRATPATPSADELQSVPKKGRASKGAK